jgi:hypothetical protein
MAKSNRRARAAVAGEALALLASLAERGAYALVPRTSDDHSEACVVFSARAGVPHPAATVSRGTLAFALRSGWVERHGDTGRIAISPSGRRMVRAAKARAATVAAGKGADNVGKARASEQEGPLAWLRRRRNKFGQPFMSEAQIAAAERLAADFWHGGLMPRVTADWSAAAPRSRMRRATPGIGVEASDAALAARQRVHKALSAVGPELSRMLVEVCCHEVGLEAIEQAAGWPQRTARVVLDLALKELARHYGLLPPEQWSPGRMRHWGDADYRPTLEPWR